MKLVIGTYLTADGVMQAPGAPDEDRSGGFEHGGWLVPHFDEGMRRLAEEWTARAQALLLGRRTYEILAAHWPRVGDDDPIAATLNRIPKHVVSTTLRDPGWGPVEVIAGDVPEAVEGLMRSPGGELHVIGSGELARTLIADDLVDEYRLWVAPVLLGSGRRLFASGTVPAGLELTDIRTSSTGVVISTYRPAGAPARGSFALADAAEAA